MKTNLPLQAIVLNSFNPPQFSQILYVQNSKPKNIWEANGMNSPVGGGFGVFLWSLLWLIPILGIAFFLWRRKF